ncbi:unnamed protein product [Calicophoron daubneyi]|uniref:UBC core domain-containing protein n=1 Tax=Calicophoron daubneyi TaxID=300641 RepID=A0AAV2TKD5_CALDB
MTSLNRRSFGRDFRSLYSCIEDEFQGQVKICDMENLDMSEFSVEVVPAKGIYAHGCFRFHIKAQEPYPQYPPTVTCQTAVFHPNIHFGMQHDNVCFNVTSQWSSAFTLKDILSAILFLFYEPNFSDPWNIHTHGPPDGMSLEQCVRQSFVGGFINGMEYPPNKAWCAWARDHNILLNDSQLDDIPKEVRGPAVAGYTNKTELHHQDSGDVYSCLSILNGNSVTDLQSLEPSTYLCGQYVAYFSMDKITVRRMVPAVYESFPWANYFRYYFAEILNDSGSISFPDYVPEAFEEMSNSISDAINYCPIQRATTEYWYLHVATSSSSSLNSTVINPRQHTDDEVATAESSHASDNLFDDPVPNEVHCSADFEEEDGGLPLTAASTKSVHLSSPNYSSSETIHSLQSDRVKRRLSTRLQNISYGAPVRNGVIFRHKDRNNPGRRATIEYLSPVSDTTALEFGSVPVPPSNETAASYFELAFVDPPQRPLVNPWRSGVNGRHCSSATPSLSNLDSLRTKCDEGVLSAWNEAHLDSMPTEHPGLSGHLELVSAAEIVQNGRGPTDVDCDWCLKWCVSDHEVCLSAANAECNLMVETSVVYVGDGSLPIVISGADLQRRIGTETDQPISRSVSHTSSHSVPPPIHSPHTAAHNAELEVKSSMKELRPLWWPLFQTRWPSYLAPGELVVCVPISANQFQGERFRPSSVQLYENLFQYKLRNPNVSTLILVDNLALSPFSPMFNRLVSIPQTYVLGEGKEPYCIWKCLEWISPSEILYYRSAWKSVDDIGLISRSSFVLGGLCLFSNWLGYLSRLELYSHPLGYSRRITTMLIDSMGVGCISAASLNCGQCAAFDGWPLWLAYRASRLLCSLFWSVFCAQPVKSRYGHSSLWFPLTDVDEI